MEDTEKLYAGWGELEREAPAFATEVRSRFEVNVHHILRTIRPDGSPRLSGTEVRIADGEVTLGMMPRSRKLADVRRDPASQSTLARRTKSSRVATRSYRAWSLR